LENAWWYEAQFDEKVKKKQAHSFSILFFVLFFSL
jgi:hypothetical protein